MAIFTSESMANGGLPVVAPGPGRYSLTRKITLKNGTPLALNDVLKFARIAGNTVVENVTIKTSDLDTGSLIAATAGFVRATVNPRKPFDAQTNPYLAGAATADTAAALAAAATIQGTLRTGGIIKAVLAAEADGVADLALTITAAPSGNPTADREIEVTVDFIGKDVNPGEFSGINVYDYLDDSSN
jgi:hypothetical protein